MHYKSKEKENYVCHGPKILMDSAQWKRAMG